METIYILLGSNLGDPFKNLSRAIEQIKTFGPIIGSSSVYQTKAWGDIVQDDFLNQVVKFESDDDPQMLLNKFKAIEVALGRTSTVKWGPRIMDIDILFVGNKIIESDRLTIPHPHIRERRFVLEPLFEIAPDFIHPVFKQSIRELLKQCPDTLAVSKILAR